MPAGYKAGYIAIIGKPNVGKSTLLNALIGQTIAAVSSQPQTTRQRITGILTQPGMQMIFLDSPGFSARGGPAGGGQDRPLNKWMRREIRFALQDADVILMMSAMDSPWNKLDQELYGLASQTKKPVFCLLNKMDIFPKEELLPRLAVISRDCGGQAPFPISAQTGAGTTELVAAIGMLLPEHLPFYPTDQPTDQSVRSICAELIRARAMEALREEIPYALAVFIEQFKEPRRRGEITEIRGVIVVEKESQKPIVIGKGGSRLKAIGKSARRDIEILLQRQIFLSLFAKVSKNWTKDPRKRKEFGYG